MFLGVALQKGVGFLIVENREGMICELFEGVFHLILSLDFVVFEV